MFITGDVFNGDIFLITYSLFVIIDLLKSLSDFPDFAEPLVTIF